MLSLAVCKEDTLVFGKKETSKCCLPGDKRSRTVHALRSERERDGRNLRGMFGKRSKRRWKRGRVGLYIVSLVKVSSVEQELMERGRFLVECQGMKV